MALATRVSVCCDLNPSEDESQVRRALSNLFADMIFSLDRGIICAHSDTIRCLEGVREQVHNRQTASSLARQIRHNTNGDSFWFYLNKQAASASVAAVCETADESPLGPIRVSVQSADIGQAAQWIAPAGRDGP